MLSAIMLLLGGVTVFILGLRLIGENVERALGENVRRGIASATKRPLTACLFGAGVTAVAQSSVAVNMAVISLVDIGVVTFTGACAVIIGTNIGTTMTAQLVSLSFASFDVTAIGSLVCFFGFVLSGVKGGRFRAHGDILLGFGLIFIGIEIMTDTAKLFYGEEFFTRLFSIRSAPIMLLNGFFITALCQSSSVVSSLLVILAADGKIDFYSAVFIILGSNVGTCAAVMVATRNKGLVARRAALFNLIFNAVGAALFAAAFGVFKDFFIDLFTKNAGIARAVANFHTFFNTVSALLLFPFLKPLGRLCGLICKEKTSVRESKRTDSSKIGRKSDEIKTFY